MKNQAVDVINHGSFGMFGYPLLTLAVWEGV
jgi:hypothetical protein